MSAVLAASCRGRWRQGIAAAGFPLSALGLGLGQALPAWVWLLALLPLLAELSAGKSVEEALGAAPLELLGIAPAPLNEGCNSASQAE